MMTRARAKSLSPIRSPMTPKTGFTKPASWRATLPDGNVEWAGRNDRRVNIRGFRVELGEIEAGARTAPGRSKCRSR